MRFTLRCWNWFRKNAEGWLKDCRFSAAKEEAMVWVGPKTESQTTALRPRDDKT
jgi:hypothetical protein